MVTAQSHYLQCFLKFCRKPFAEDLLPSLLAWYHWQLFPQFSTISSLQMIQLVSFFYFYLFFIHKSITYITLHYTTLHYITLHYITLHQINTSIQYITQIIIHRDSPEYIFYIFNFFSSILLTLYTYIDKF